MTFRHNDSVPLAAAKASMSTSTGFRIERDPRLPSHKQKPRGRRRSDPLAGIFDEKVVPMLIAEPGLRAVAIYRVFWPRRSDMPVMNRSYSPSPAKPILPTFPVLYQRR